MVKVGSENFLPEKETSLFHKPCCTYVDQLRSKKFSDDTFMIQVPKQGTALHISGWMCTDQYIDSVN